ncbi:MAG: TolC family protein [Flavobacteriales bacterium]|nr:TolC family protein [Flavobacteriales bacterium]
MRIFFLSFIIFCASITGLSAQEEWTLERCIAYAIDNNIQIKQSALNEASARLGKTQSLAQLFPNLNVGTGFGMNFGRSIDPGTNTFVTDQVNTNNFRVSTSVTLFNGFRLLNTLKQSQLDVLSAEYDLKGLSNDISMNIATAFLQVMFNEELLLIAQDQQDITAQQMERTKKLVNAGSIPKGNLFDAQAQMANDELQVVNMENNLSTSVLTLKQILNLKASDPFRIERPPMDLPIENLNAVTIGSIYDNSLNNWPQIKARETQLKSAEKGEKIAFASYTPTLSANASVSTLFSSSYKNSYLDSSFNLIREDIAYGDQLNQNLSENIGFSLNIPLFNGLQSRTAVNRSRLTRINAELQLQDEQNRLYSSIQQAYNDAQAANRKFEASEKSVNATELAFDYAEQRYEVGMMNTFEFNTSKNNLSRAKSDLLRSKYDYIFRIKVLDFYQGKPLTFNAD